LHAGRVGEVLAAIAEGKTVAALPLPRRRRLVLAPADGGMGWSEYALKTLSPQTISVTDVDNPRITAARTIVVEPASKGRCFTGRRGWFLSRSG
jgi:hypothetical protein